MFPRKKRKEPDGHPEVKRLTLRETRDRYPHTSGFMLFKVLASVSASSASLRFSSYVRITHKHTHTHTYAHTHKHANMHRHRHTHTHTHIIYNNSLPILK